MLILTSCVKHDIYNTVHPDKGALVVTADFSSRSASANVPSTYFISLSSGEAVGGPDILNEVQGSTNVVKPLLDPKTYSLLVYNLPDGITVDGTEATVNSVQTSRASSYEIEATPDYLFAAYGRVSIAEDDTTWVTVDMKQYIKLLTITLHIKDGDASRIKSVECTLDGVVPSVNLATGELSDYSSYVVNEMVLDGSTLSTFFRLFGVDTSGNQTLTVKITYVDGEVDEIEEDITDIIKYLNNSDEDEISGNVRLPSASGFTATIEGWDQTGDEYEAK